MDPFYSLAPLPSYPPAVASTFPLSRGSRRAALVVTFTRGTHLTGEGTLNIVVP